MQEKFYDTGKVHSTETLIAYLESQHERTGKDTFSTADVEIKEHNDIVALMYILMHREDLAEKYNVDIKDGNINNGQYNIPLIVFTRQDGQQQKQRKEAEKMSEKNLVEEFFQEERWEFGYEVVDYDIEDPREFWVNGWAEFKDINGKSCTVYNEDFIGAGDEVKIKIVDLEKSWLADYVDIKGHNKGDVVELTEILKLELLQKVYNYIEQETKKAEKEERQEQPNPYEIPEEVREQAERQEQPTGRSHDRDDLTR